MCLEKAIERKYTASRTYFTYLGDLSADEQQVVSVAKML